jgi:hypothetical protein
MTQQQQQQQQEQQRLLYRLVLAGGGRSSSQACGCASRVSGSSDCDQQGLCDGTIASKRMHVFWPKYLG